MTVSAINAPKLAVFFEQVRSGGTVVKLTKIDIAEAHIRAAVRLFFEDEHPAPVYLLACPAREVLTTLGDKIGVDTLLHEYAANRGITLQDAVGKADQFANFMKHANRDPQAVLEEFSDEDNDHILMIACKDFVQITGGLPIEAQIFEAWWYAAHIKRISDRSRGMRERVKLCIQAFPLGFRSAAREDKKKMALDVLMRPRTDPSLRMEIKRVVELPKDL